MLHILPSPGAYPDHIHSLLSALVQTQQAKTTSPGTTLTDTYLMPALHRARLIKDDYEIAQIKMAIDISSHAHTVVMRVLGETVIAELQRNRTSRRNIESESDDIGALPRQWLIHRESDVEAIFVASCRRNG